MNKITTRFAVLLATAAVVPLLLYGLVSVLSLQQGTQTTVIAGNTNVARRAAEHIELYIDNSVRILHAVASDLQHTGLERWQQDRILKNFVLQFPEFTEITLLDQGGAPAVSSRIGRPGVSIPGADSMQFKGAYMSPFSLDDDLLPTAVLAVRLSGNGADGGWLVGRVSLEELWRMVDRIKVGEQGVALVVTGQDQLLAHGDTEEKAKVARGDDMRAHPLIARLAESGPKGPATLSGEYAGSRGQMLGVAARVPSLGWTVIVEQPRSEAYAIAAQLQMQLGLAIGVSLLAMVAVGYYNGRRFITPIFDLMKGTRALAAGRLEERVVIDSTDEFGQLGSAFNNMADRLVELQVEVRKQERQATFGRIAAGLAHDISTPIQNLGNACKLIVKKFDDLEYRGVFQRTIERELALVRRFLDDLRQLTTPVPLQKSLLEVNKAVAELVESMDATVQHAGLTLVGALAPAPVHIVGDQFALNRVYSNLITNACQATTPGGTVTIRTRSDGTSAVIEVADTGSGIPAERLGSIFDEFVSTKRQGLGLGLAVCKKTVEQLGGTIAVASVVGQGTTFTLRFPLAGGPGR